MESTERGRPGSGLTRIVLIFLIVFAPSVASAQSVVFQWNGVLEFVDFDSTTGVLTGGTPGVSLFEGYAVHPTTCGAGCIVEPFPPFATNYVFPGGSGLLKGLGVSLPGVESAIEITDDEIVDQDGVDLAAFFGITVTLGQTVDAWVVASQNDAATASELVDWDVTFLYINTNPFTSTAFVATPPPNPDLILFEVAEDDGDVYGAIGSAAAVPEPSLPLSLMSGGVGLLLLLRPHRQPCHGHSAPC